MQNEKDFFVCISSYVATKGTKIIINEKYQELKDVFGKTFLEKTINDIESIKSEYDDKKSSLLIYDEEEVGKGGVLASLWKICERNKVGLRYSLSDIPIMQATIEIANYYDINPYRLLSENTKIYFLNKKIKENNEFSDLINNKYRQIRIIGETNEKKQRIRIDNDTDSFLIKYYKDEIEKIIEREVAYGKSK